MEMACAYGAEAPVDVDENKNPQKIALLLCDKLDQTWNGVALCPPVRFRNSRTAVSNFQKGDQKFLFYVLFQHPPEVTIRSVFLFFFFFVL